MGDIEVEPIYVDHSIPAAYGFLAHTFEGTVAYTSDLRMHGARKDLTDDFVKEATESEPVALVCEGTRMGLKEKRKNYSEAPLLLALNPYLFLSLKSLANHSQWQVRLLQPAPKIIFQKTTIDSRLTKSFFPQPY